MYIFSAIKLFAVFLYLVVLPTITVGDDDDSPKICSKKCEKFDTSKPHSPEWAVTRIDIAEGQKCPEGYSDNFMEEIMQHLPLRRFIVPRKFVEKVPTL